MLTKRALAVWLRNFGVWKKLAIPSVLGNIIEPMLYLVGLGYGLGSMLPSVGGFPYLHFLAAGIVCQSTMNSATFEALYSAFSRLHVQRTWEAILHAPVSIDEVLMGEWLWAASKSFLSGLAILFVMVVWGITSVEHALFAVPVVFLIGLCFAGIGLIVTCVSPSYDFFMYYFTLVIGPMLFVSGVFYPVSQLPDWLQIFSQLLPLTHAIELLRPVLLTGESVHPLQNIAVLVFYALVGFNVSRFLARRRLLR
ncbi:ABC transporter permease [Leeia sp. TBRC 13508]|uniref:Transport permease protein n=1 Tax=Leeia speluncae TaxID=2884804 RepID=A0ABS8D9D5_9NEIS|nr:ABC transporter permease [Leeia speluncae]MCB6184789.1 ABC transporter permease [Leeia speluncae]